MLRTVYFNELSKYCDTWNIFIYPLINILFHNTVFLCCYLSSYLTCLPYVLPRQNFVPFGRLETYPENSWKKKKEISYILTDQYEKYDISGTWWCMCSTSFERCSCLANIHQVMKKMDGNSQESPDLLLIKLTSSKSKRSCSKHYCLSSKK